MHGTLLLNSEKSNNPVPHSNFQAFPEKKLSPYICILQGLEKFYTTLVRPDLGSYATAALDPYKHKNIKDLESIQNARFKTSTYGKKYKFLSFESIAG